MRIEALLVGCWGLRRDDRRRLHDSHRRLARLLAPVRDRLPPDELLASAVPARRAQLTAKPLIAMTDAGWRLQNTLSDHLFDVQDQKLTPAGKIKMRMDCHANASASPQCVCPARCHTETYAAASGGRATILG